MATAAQIPLIARQYDFTETNISATASVTTAVTANAQRVALGFGQLTSGTAQISTRSTMGVTDGTAVPTGGGIFWLTFSDHGSLCQQQWFCIASTPPSKMNVFEVFYRDR